MGEHFCGKLTDEIIQSCQTNKTEETKRGQDNIMFHSKDDQKCSVDMADNPQGHILSNQELAVRKA